MARLNLRPIYDQNELTGGERITRGIGGAIDAYSQHQDVARQDESRRRAAGQVMTTQGAGGVDRLRNLGRRLLGRGDPEVTASSAPPPPGFNPALASRPTERITPTRVAVDNTMPPDAPMFGGGAMGGALAQRPSMSMAQDRTPMPAPAAAPMPTGPMRPRTIGSALDSYTENDNNGNTWTIDPNRDANRKLAADNAEMNMKEDRTHQSDEEKIASLTSAGMPAAEARARVLNNVVRYDQTFGQQVRGATGVSQKDWMAREDARQKHRLDMETAHNAGKITSQQLAQERLALQREEVQDRRDQFNQRQGDSGVTRELGITGAIERTLTKDPIAASIQTPDQKAAEKKRIDMRDKHLNRAVTDNERNNNRRATQAEAATYYAKLTGTHEERVKQMKAAGFK